jgi:hypothetical protein
MTLVEAGPDTALRTEYPFTLPRGYVDQHGRRHRDELTTQNDPRVRQNPAYLTVLLLERTITRLGEVRDVDTFVVENLFASDLAFLQDLYRRINQDGHAEVAVGCPHCGQEFAVDIAGDVPGGS